MKTAALQREFRRQLELRLKMLGFERSRISWLSGHYSREVARIQQGVGIRIEPYLDDVEAEIVNVSVRFNDVEDLVAKFEQPHPLMSPEDVAARSTLTVQVSANPGTNDPLCHWGGEKRRLWLIHSTDEIPSSVSEMLACISTECEPILVALSSTDRALVLLSGDDEQSRTYAGPDDVRAKRSIALAFLLHGTAAARQLARTKLTRLRGEGRAEVEKWTTSLFRAHEQSGAT